MTPGHVLIVDDQVDMARALADALRSSAIEVQVAADGGDALARCQKQAFDVVLTDVRMPGMDGVELMKRLRRARPDLPVILITADGSIAAAVAALKQGAYDYVTKPCDPQELRTVVGNALASRAVSRTTRGSSPPRRAPNGTEELIGSSAVMVALRERVARIAPADSSVLITGETGTGKELIARAIHASSTRRAKPFVTVNASAIPESLLESEMFGHVRGAFTGATQTHRGYFVEADGGTLLLDEIGDMPLPLQAKLLRVLQVGEVRAVGADQSRTVDVRILAATHRALPDLIRAGQFREDLYYRLNVINVAAPPLRARSGDIRELALTFFDRARSRMPSARAMRLHPDLLDLLERSPWPGNVRELESAMERLVVLSPAEEISPDHLTFIELPDELPKGVAPPVAGELCAIDHLVQRHVDVVLEHTGGNKSRAAKILGVDLSTLYRWQAKWKKGVEPEAKSEEPSTESGQREVG